jgi:hypothetical protein
MGMCIDNRDNPALGEYSVEVRRESFILRGADSYDKDAVPHGIFVVPDYLSRQGSAEIEIADIPKIRAALDEVERYLKSRERNG